MICVGLLSSQDFEGSMKLEELLRKRNAHNRARGVAPKAPHNTQTHTHTRTVIVRDTEEQIRGGPLKVEVRQYAEINKPIARNMEKYAFVQRVPKKGPI